MTVLAPGSVLLLPPALLAEILPFLKAGKTGRILLGVNRGRIESCEVTAHVRAISVSDKKDV